MKKVIIALKIILRFLPVFIFANLNLWINANAFPFLKDMIGKHFPNMFGALLVVILFIYSVAILGFFAYALYLNLRSSCKKYGINYR